MHLHCKEPYFYVGVYAKHFTNLEVARSGERFNELKLFSFIVKLCGQERFLRPWRCSGAREPFCNLCFQGFLIFLPYNRNSPVLGVFHMDQNWGGCGRSRSICRFFLCVFFFFLLKVKATRSTSLGDWKPLSWGEVHYACHVCSSASFLMLSLLSPRFHPDLEEPPLVDKSRGWYLGLVYT